MTNLTSAADAQKLTILDNISQAAEGIVLLKKDLTIAPKKVSGVWARILHAISWIKGDYNKVAVAKSIEKAIPLLLKGADKSDINKLKTNLNKLNAVFVKHLQLTNFVSNVKDSTITQDAYGNPLPKDKIEITNILQKVISRLSIVELPTPQKAKLVTIIDPVVDREARAAKEEERLEARFKKSAEEAKQMEEDSSREVEVKKNAAAAESRKEEEALAPIRKMVTTTSDSYEMLKNRKILEDLTSKNGLGYAVKDIAKMLSQDTRSLERGEINIPKELVQHLTAKKKKYCVSDSPERRNLRHHRSEPKQPETASEQSNSRILDTLRKTAATVVHQIETVTETATTVAKKVGSKAQKTIATVQENREAAAVAANAAAEEAASKLSNAKNLLGEIAIITGDNAEDVLTKTEEAHKLIIESNTLVQQHRKNTLDREKEVKDLMTEVINIQTKAYKELIDNPPVLNSVGAPKKKKKARTVDIEAPKKSTPRIYTAVARY